MNLLWGWRLLSTLLQGGPGLVRACCYNGCFDSYALSCCACLVQIHFLFFPGILFQIFMALTWDLLHRLEVQVESLMWILHFYTVAYLMKCSLRYFKSYLMTIWYLYILMFPCYVASATSIILHLCLGSAFLSSITCVRQEGRTMAWVGPLQCIVCYFNGLSI